MLEVRGLNKRYTISDETTVALDNVTLTLPDKGLVLVTGKNGSGKTTFLNMIGLIDAPDDGSILFNGKEIVGLTGKDADSYRSDNVSFIFQTLNLVSTLSAKQNLLFVGIDEQTAVDALQSVGLKDCIDKLPAQMSQGQAQKVAVQRAILTDTAILLADEPTSALDKEARADVAKMLAKASQNKLVLVITHDLQLFERADMLITFEDGKAVITSYASDIENVEVNQDNEREATLQSQPSEKLSTKFGYKSLFASAMNASKRKVIATMVISLLFLLMFVGINVLMSVPYDFNSVYMKLANYYEQSGYKYVIVEDIVDGEPRNSCVNVKEFDYSELWSIIRKNNNDVIEIAEDLSEATPRLSLYYYPFNKTIARVVQSSVITEDINGKIPDGKQEIAITDYYADLLIYYYGYADYQDILNRASLTLQFDGNEKGSTIGEVKVVGITHTQKDDFAAVKDLYESDIEDLFSNTATTKAEEEWIKFKIQREYSLACVYMQDGFDDDMAKSMPYIRSSGVNYETNFRTYNVARLSSLDGVMDFSKDVYTLKEGEGVYIRLSDVVTANQMYQVIKDCANESERRVAVAEFVKTIELSKIMLSNYKSFNKQEYSIGASVVGFIDDIGKETMSAVFATESFADEYFQKCIDAYVEENPLKSYVMVTKADDVYKLLVGRDGKWDQFPAMAAMEGIDSAISVLGVGSIIVAAVLIIFALALLFNDASYYFKGHTRDFAVLKALGAPMRKVAFVSMIRYGIAIIASLAISLIIAPIILSFANSFGTRPYNFTWLTFSPWGIVVSLTLTLIMLAISFSFQYRVMKKKSLGQLLKDGQ